MVKSSVNFFQHDTYLEVFHGTVCTNETDGTGGTPAIVKKINLKYTQSSIKANSWK